MQSIPTLNPNTQNAPSQAQVLQTVQTVLVQHVRQLNPQCSASIQDNTSLDALGLDSVARVGLVSELEKVFNISLDPGAAFDYVTVSALAAYVWGQLTGQPVDVSKLLDV